MAVSKRIVFVCAALAALVAGCGGGEASETARADRADREARPGARFVDVGGYEMYLQCNGKGSPTVVIESGAGLHSLDWREIQPHVAQVTRVCSYDRAGLGLSDDPPDGNEEAEFGEEAIAKQLHALLRKAGVEPPFVLTGHSMGGLYNRVYNRTYPDEVVGMVLVDSVSGAEAPLGDMPLAVLVQSGSGLSDGWAKDQQRLARLSSNSVLVEATESGHYIEQDQPGLVVEAIRQVVAAARADGDLPPCEEIFPRVGGECLLG